MAGNSLEHEPIRMERMMQRTLVLVLAMLWAIRACAAAPDDDVSSLPPKPLESGHAPVNGISMYYEVHGRHDGVPLVLLHGGGSTIEVTFSRVLPVFAGS